MVHAHRVILGREPIRTQWLNLKPEDITLVTGKNCWTYSMGVGYFDTWASHATALMCLGRSQPHSWFDLIQRFQVTVFVSSPVLFRQFKQLNLPLTHDLSSLKCATSAGEKLSTSTRESWMNRYHVPIYEALGMTELSTCISFGPAVSYKEGSIGFIQSGRQIKIVSLDDSAVDAVENEIVTA